VRRCIPGLHETDPYTAGEVPDALYLVRVDRVQYRWHTRKPYYVLRFAVVEPPHFAGRLITGRIYCTAKALWKLTWFLRDFGYDTDLLGRDEVDEKTLVGLRGVIKISHAVVNGITRLNLDGFAPVAQWEELSPSWAHGQGSEAAS
jgi:hypothetical protein